MGFLKVSIYYRDLIAKIKFSEGYREFCHAVSPCPGSLTGGPVPSWRLRGVRVEAGVASAVADVWARAASVSGKKGD